MQDPDNYIGWNSPEEITWILDQGNDFPRLYWQVSSGTPLSAETLEDYLAGNGTENQSYLIETAEQLNVIGLFPEYWDQNYFLVADVNLLPFTGTEFNRIGVNYGMPFTGTFDGDQHRILNFTYSANGYESNVGLFGYGFNCTIKNLGFEDLYVSSLTSDIGGLIGYLRQGTMTQCFTSGTVTGISDSVYLGGLAGHNYSSHILKCNSTVNVSGHQYIGGLLGYNYRGTVEACYSEGSVDGNNYIGGLVGYNFRYGIISDSFSSCLYPYPLSRQKLQVFKVDSSPCIKAVGTEGARRATGVPTATPYTSAWARDQQQLFLPSGDS